MKKVYLALLLVSCLALLGSCGGAGGVQNCAGAACVPQGATHFVVMASSANAGAGVAFNFTVKALDAAGTVVATYAGTVHFTSSDPHALLPNDTTLSTGTGNFSVTFQSPGNQTVTATDTASASISGTSASIAVGSGPATHFLVSGPAAATTGIAFQIMVTAQDAFNNTTASYTGTVHFTSSDAQASLPANMPLAAGTGTFSATLKTLGGQTITATDTVSASINGTSASINMVSNAPTHFSVTAPFHWNPASAFKLSVNALDAANNVASTYAGTIHFTSTDALAALPANSTLTNGTGSFSATLNTLGNQTITATDTANASITGTSNSIDVEQFVITSGPPPDGTVGVGYGTQNCTSPSQIGFTLRTNAGSKFEIWSGSALPPGLQIGKFTCPGVPPVPTPTILWLLYGNPTQAGTFYNVVITAFDPFHGRTSATYTITINPPPPTSAAARHIYPNAPHHHYKLIVLGTLGGPQSYGDAGHGAANITSRGTAAGVADTSISDPYFPNFNPFLSGGSLGSYPFVFHAFSTDGSKLIDLGGLPGANSSTPSHITENGLVSGQSLNGSIDPISGWPQLNAVLWADGQVMNLGTLGGGYESVSARVNSQGQVTGSSTNNVPDPYSLVYFVLGGGLTNGTQNRAFVWDHKNGMRDLGTLGGPDASALALNDRGQIVGLSYINDIPNPVSGIPTVDPFLWDDGRMIDLGSLGGTFGLAGDINNVGQVIGNSDLAGDSTQHGFIWDHGKLTDIGTLGGTLSFANALNERGHVAGQSTVANGDLHAYIWQRGVMTDLGPVPGFDDTTCIGAFGINSHDQVVGQAVQNSCNGPDAHAFLWENGDSIDANDLVPPGSDLTLNEIEQINDRGEMFGIGTLTNGQNRAFLLIPCDENHPKIEGCDYNLFDPPDAAVVGVSSARAADSAAALPGVGSLPRAAAGVSAAGRFMPGRRAGLNLLPRP